MAIVYRTAGAWGAGQGFDLAAAQIDNNFFEIVTRVTTLETTPPTAVSIDHFVIEGTLLTIFMTNGDEHGPFVLPVAQWRWTGEWQAAVQYFVGDIVTNDGSTYFVRVQHISDTTFDPGLVGVDGQVYILLLSKATQPYDIGLFYNDVVPAGDAIIMLHVAVRDVSLPAMFAGAQGFLRVATSSATITLPIYVNEVIVGRLQFTPGTLTATGGGQYGTFDTIDPLAGVNLVPGDRLAIALPYEDDDTAEALAVTIPGVVAGL